jgi:hypothetical protein
MDYKVMAIIQGTISVGLGYYRYKDLELSFSEVEFMTYKGYKKCNVLRDNSWRLVPYTELVPGKRNIAQSSARILLT